MKKVLALVCLFCFISCSAKHVSVNSECKRADYCDENDPYGCAGIVTLNTLITTFDATVITPVNVAWITLLAMSCMEQPTTVTSRTTGYVHHDTLYVNTQYYVREGKPATPMPLTADGKLPVIPYIKWYHSKNAKFECP